MADAVEVRLGATTGPATDSMSSAASSIDASLRTMAEALAAFTRKNKESTEQVASAWKQMGDNIKRVQEGVTSAIEKLKQVGTTLTAVLAGGTLWHEAVSAMTGFRDEVRSLQISLGLSSEKATELAVSLKLAGSSSEAYEQMAQRVGRVLKTQTEEFDRLRVKTKDARGDLLPMDQILQNIFTRMQDFKAGTDQMEFALSTVGRNAKDFAAEMIALNAVSGRATQMMHEFGIEMGPERQAAVGRYKIEMNAFKVLLEEMAIRIGESVLPRLEQFAKWINGEGASALHSLEVGLKSIATVVVVVGDTFGAIARYIGISIGEIVRQIELWGEATKAYYTLNLPALKNAVRASFASASEYAAATTETWVKGFRDARAAIDAIWTAPPKAPLGLPDSPIRSGKERFRPKPTGDAMSALETELARQRGQFEAMKTAQGSFESWSLEQTRNYWLAALQLQGISAKDREEIERKYWDSERKLREDAFGREIEGLEEQKAHWKFNFDQRVAIAEQEYRMIAQKYGAASKEAIAAEKRITEEKQRQVEQRIKLDDLEQKRREQTSKFGYDMARMNADQQVALGQMSTAQRLQIERDYLSQEYTLERDALQQRIDLMASDPNSDPAKLQELKNQLLTIEQTYQKQLTEIDNKAVLDRKQFAIDAANAIRSAMENALASLTDASKSWKDKFLGFVNEITKSLDQIAAKQIVKQLFGPGTSGGGILSGITDKIFGKGAFGGEDTGLQAAGTALTTAGTTLESSGVTLDASGALLNTAGASLEAAAAALQASAATMGAGGGGGIGSLLGGGGDFGSFLDSGAGSAFGLPMFAEGTPMIQRSGLAVVHKGEAVIPASMNKPGKLGGNVSINNQFVLSGPMDTRTQAQIAMASRRAVEHATSRNA